MALTPDYTREQARFALVSSYTVGRINQYPTVRVTFDEVVYLPEISGLVVASFDRNLDTYHEVIQVAGWEDRTDLVGRDLCLANSTLLGRVVATEVVTPEGEDPVLEITLDMGSAYSLEGQTVSLIARMPVGTTAYRRARSGHGWELLLDGSDPAAMARMGQMLGTVYFKALKAGLTKLGLTEISDAAILSAVQELAAEGINIDGLLGQEGEQLEVDRRNGDAPEVRVVGNAP